jgi:CRP-like cAMP-binding protein
VKRNRLLRDLDADEAALVAPHLQEVALDRGNVLVEPGDALPHVYFPVEGVLALAGATESGATVEVADVGREGMAAVSAILGTHRLPFRIVTKISHFQIKDNHGRLCRESPSQWA